jgi:hypothetical protein
VRITDRAGEQVFDAVNTLEGLPLALMAAWPIVSGQVPPDDPTSLQDTPEYQEMLRRLP